MRIEEEGRLTIALNNKKLTYEIGAPRNSGNKQMKAQTRKLFLFPASQETVDAVVLLEIMKIRQSNLFRTETISVTSNYANQTLQNSGIW